MTPTEVRSLREALVPSQGFSLPRSRAIVARMVGVEPRTWLAWEYGERNVPEPVQRLLQLAVEVPEARIWLLRKVP